MADINSFMNELTSAEFFGIPVIFIIGIMVVLFVIILKTRGKKKDRPRLNLTKATKEYFDNLYNIFYEKDKKKILQGFNSIGFALGHFTMYWDSTTNLKAELAKIKTEGGSGKLKNKLKAAIDAESEDNKNIKELIVIRYCERGILSKAMAKIFKKYKYMLVPADKIEMDDKIIKLDRLISKDEFNGTVYFSAAGKESIENIAYKISREEELCEIADYIPKQNYLEKETASKTIRAREDAEIEKEKYKGQITAAGD